MATLLIRNLDDSLKAALRKRAAANGRSMEEEARRILDAEIYRDSRRPDEGLGTWLHRRFTDIGGGELLIPPRKGGIRKPPFVTDEEWKQWNEAFEALIAATAVVHNLTLATMNVKDIEGIDGLKLVDPSM